MFHEIRDLGRFQTAKVTFKVIQGIAMVSFDRPHKISHLVYQSAHGIWSA